MTKRRAFAFGLAVTLGTFVLGALLLELVVFRFIWLASDAPRLDYVDDVVRYAPNQNGVWRVADEIAAPYRINAQGWNSGAGDYVRERMPGTLRIAVVGDSMVEALQVAPTDSAAERLGRNLNDAGVRAEVYRFGFSGAPLSHYVHMVERAVVQYRPDWIVVVGIHNDFDESYQFKQGRYVSSFLKFRVENDKVTGEVPPTPWQPDLIEQLRRTATARFLLYRWRLRPQVIIDLLLPRPANANEMPWATDAEMNRVLKERREVAAVTDHAVTRLAALATGIGARLLLVMDGHRYAIYAGEAQTPALVLNAMLGETARRYRIDFLDLHPVFAAHWAAHRRRFDFNADGHWNEMAHSIVGAAIAERIRPPAASR